MIHSGRRDPVCKVGHPGAEDSELLAGRLAGVFPPFSSLFPRTPSILFVPNPSSRASLFHPPPPVSSAVCPPLGTSGLSAATVARSEVPGEDKAGWKGGGESEQKGKINQQNPSSHVGVAGVHPSLAG